MFNLPNEVRDSLKDYKRNLEELQDGKISSARFKGIRVPWGIYSHRGGGVFMTRIRIPAALVSGSQLKALALVSQKYGNGMLHITTRQDIQLHDVKIEDTIRIMEYLQDYNLSPRGGGGNTIRNVIACPLAGLCREELFDVRKYAIALTEHLLREESSFNLPRKFKIGFSGCDKDCAGCAVNDLGFLAKFKNGKKGFKVFAGGGMGLSSHIGHLLEEFIREEDLTYCVQAVKNIYYKVGDRRNKHHNRLRFLIEDIGREEFKEVYEKEFKDLKEKEYIVLRKIDFPERKTTDSEIPRSGDEEYKEFLTYNVLPQRQNGFASVGLRIPRGDISAGSLAKLADLENYFPGIGFRTSGNQNLFITWVKNQDLYNIFLRLKEILAEFLYPGTLLDVVACKGALTCNLGLCNSPALASEIEDVIKGEFTPLEISKTPDKKTESLTGFIGKKVFHPLDIKINGCPNACGQQPIGKLSFYGVVRKVDNRPVPFYKFLIGGRKEAESTKFAEEIGMIPAKNIPHFLRDFLRKIDEEIDENTDIHEFLNGPAKQIAKKVLEDYSYVSPYSEDRNYYIDWGKTEEFSLAGIGPGECGAGVLDMIEADLDEANILLGSIEKEAWPAEGLKKVLFLSARALLVVKGRDPKNESEALSDFKETFIDTGIASSGYSNIKDIFESINDALAQEEKKEKFRYTEEFLEHVNKLYKSMDAFFNFPNQEARIRKEAKKPTEVLDLKGTPCPINYVKAKLVLENLDAGSTLEIVLDEGRPIESVPKSLENDGYQILKIEKEESFYKVLVRKK